MTQQLYTSRKINCKYISRYISYIKRGERGDTITKHV